MTFFTIIAAVDEAGGLGRQGQLPWRIPGELRHFREVTIGDGQQTVIMGRTTWESLPPSVRPLPQRMNIVLSRTATPIAGAHVAGSLDEAIRLAGTSTKIFVIGGAKVYHEAIRHPACHQLLLTRVQGGHDCDVFFPSIPAEFHLDEKTEPMTEAGETYWFEGYRRD